MRDEPSDGRWNWDAEEYARNSAAQLGWALELIEKLGLRGDESILDIGCGDGKVTAELARRVPRGAVVGVDSSEAMIERASASWAPERHPSLSFLPADARELHFAARFDVAFSNATLHWIADHRAVLRGVARALKPGGRLLFQMGGRGNGAEIFAVADEMVASSRWHAWFEGFGSPWSFYGPEEYGSWCSAAGLRLVRAELLPRLMLQNGAEGLSGWVRTTWMPYTARLPEEKRGAFVAEAVERYLSLHPADAEGRVGVKMVRLEVEAVRP